MNTPKVTFGIVNCNRLHYMRSCLESLLYCTDSYDNKEIIIVDNASVEQGTSEYLDEKEKQGIIVIRQEKRDPSNEFAKGLNVIIENSTGEYICPLQGDMQFIVKGPWLEKYIEYFEKYKDRIGCIAFDAQRKIRIEAHAPFKTFDNIDLESDFRFFIDSKRNPICGAGDVMYSREILETIYPWNVKNKNHEGGNDSETAMLEKIEKLHKVGLLKNISCISPQIPVSAAIWTDSRGTNARVRGNRRYGDYWAPKKDFRYYEIFSLEEISSQCDEKTYPLPIDMLARGIGWDVPKDNFGRWLKNPIRPENAGPSDYVSLISKNELEEKNKSYDYVDEWLDD